MNFDNRIFNVNGKGDEGLLAALKMAFAQESARCSAKGYIIDPKFGLILLWSMPDNPPSCCNRLPAPMGAEEVLFVVKAWLASSPGTECVDDDSDCDHDGHNSVGWRVFIERWGKVAGHSCICAVKPAFLWHGK